MQTSLPKMVPDVQRDSGAQESAENQGILSLSGFIKWYQISRLVISSTKKALVLRRVNYEKHLVRTLTVPWSQVNTPIYMAFCFRLLSLERIVFEVRVLRLDFKKLRILPSLILLWISFVSNWPNVTSTDWSSTMSTSRKPIRWHFTDC